MLIYKGQTEKIRKEKGTVLFKKLYIDGMYRDGIGFIGAEDHVWIELKPFEEFSVGDYVKFDADIYRYLKVGNGKKIDYSLENPFNIKKIDAYEMNALTLIFYITFNSFWVLASPME